MKTDLSPTWNVWRLLHSTMSLDMYQMLLGVLRIKRPASGSSLLSNVWTWIIIVLLVNNASNFVSGFLFVSSPLGRSLAGPLTFALEMLIPYVITLASLRYALSITRAIAMQRELGNYDLFALLPDGEFANVLNIARTYRHPLQGNLPSFKMSLALLCVAAFVTAGIPFSFNQNLVSIDNLAFTILPVMINGIGSFVEYLQAFVAATLIALLASQRQKHAEAQLWVLGSFLGLQIVMFILMNILNAWLFDMRMYSMAGFASASFIFLSYGFYFAVRAVILIACREFINMLLWWRVQRQMES